LGDSNRGISEAINGFFILWNEFLTELFEEANREAESQCVLESESLSRLVISSIEGALLLCKASKDPTSLRKTGEALKFVVRNCTRGI
jgi:hypothetical protein